MVNLKKSNAASAAETFRLKVGNSTQDDFTCSFLGEDHVIQRDSGEMFTGIPDGTEITFIGRLGIIERIEGLQEVAGTMDPVFRIFADAEIYLRDR